MRFRRLLRIFIPLLLLAAVVAGVVVVVTSRGELQSARRQVNAAWTPLRIALDSRYDKLANAADAVRETPGPLHQLVIQIDRASGEWKNLGTNGGSVAAQVTAANDLEGLGRRFVLTALATPRLGDNAPALALVSAYAAQKPPAVASDFGAAVTHYERERDRPARRLAATILGYKSVPAYDASGSA
jgi:hypothetical protein